MIETGNSAITFCELIVYIVLFVKPNEKVVLGYTMKYKKIDDMGQPTWPVGQPNPDQF